jgi:hypothetical protein
MDNKQDRQFLWKVKDFLNKSPEVQGPKSNSLREAIGQITSLAQPVAVPRNEITQSSSGLKDKVNEVLSGYQNVINRQKPNSIKTSNNITANIFKI